MRQELGIYASLSEGEYLPILSVILTPLRHILFLHNMAPKHKAAVECLTTHLVVKQRAIPVMGENLAQLDLTEKWNIDLQVTGKYLSSTLKDF